MSPALFLVRYRLPLLAAAVAIILVGYGTWLRSCGETGRVVETRVDTVSTVITRVVPSEPVIRTRIATMIIYRDRRLAAQVDTTASGRVDTVLVAEPFAAAFDTTDKNVRVRGEIAFPPLRVAILSVELPPDTLRDHIRTSIVTQEVSRAAPWYADVGKVLGGVVVGAALGYGVRWLAE